MATFGSASGSIWENWLRDHSAWINDSRDPLDCLGKILWTPIGAASTACAAYVDELDRHPSGTLVKTAGVALSAAIPGAGLLAVAADATAVAAGQVIGGELNAKGGSPSRRSTPPQGQSPDAGAPARGPAGT